MHINPLVKICLVKCSPGAQIQLERKLLTGLKTIFGYCLTNPVPIRDLSQNTTTMLSTMLFHQLLQRFWTLEESLILAKFSNEDELCESNCNSTFLSDATGRYIVLLSFSQQSS